MISRCFSACKFLLYADDLKLYTRIDTMEDMNSVQADLYFFEDWCRCNRLSLNISKCHIIRFTRRSNLSRYPYSLSGSPLPEVFKVRDLWVYF